MLHFNSLCRAALACALSLGSSLALANGSGTIDEANLSLDYTGGPYVVPVPLTEVASLAGMTPPCVISSLGEMPFCDFYFLTINLPEELRKDPANNKATLEISLDSAGEYDYFLFDSEGNLVAEPDHLASPETLSLLLRTVPNGDYTLQIVPWMPDASTFDLHIAAVGTAPQSKNGIAEVFGGALGPLLLLPLLLGALRRARRA